MRETDPAGPTEGSWRRRELAARVFLTIATLVPYWPLLTFSVVLVTEDYFASDIFNSELPIRVLVGQLMRAGQLPLWTNQICSGYPLFGGPSDPVSLALFALLPPAAAVDTLLILIFLVAGHGTYSLARRLGFDRSGALLAGIAFANSGYIAAQLKHLSIMWTIVWLPVGVLLIDRVLAAAPGKRAVPLALLGLLYAHQGLAGFPQAAYISGLVYGSFVLFRVLSDRRRIPVGQRLPVLGGIAGALVLGAAAGAVVLLPLFELAGLSDRSGPLDYEWATYTNFWPPNLLTFFVPYINGDSSNHTYIGPPPFWEQYGYAGAATALLAIYGGVRERSRPLVVYLNVMTITSFLLILGPRTPAYYVAFQLVPGLARLRAPTRFLVVLELGLVLLAAVGLTRFREDLERRWKGASSMPRLIVYAICAVTALDLFIHQPRWNPMVPARDWLAPPRTAEIVRADTANPRTFTPHHRDIHRRAHDREALGWMTVEPYFRLRDLLEPNVGAYWNVPCADCYVGLTPRWYVTVWSYHYFENSLVHDRAYQAFGSESLVIRPPFVTQMRTFGVTHVLGPYPAKDPELNPERDPTLTLLAREPNAYIYRVEGAARVRFVRAARRMGTEAHAVARLRDLSFDPNREILLLDAPDSIHPTVEEAGAQPPGAAEGRATITHEEQGQLVVDAFAPQDGFLLLADMYYPGWRAEVDGVPTRIYRANISLRGIALPKGQHTVRFLYEPSSFFRGLWITLGAVSALFIWLGAALYGAKGRRDRLVEAD